MLSADNQTGAGGRNAVNYCKVSAETLQKISSLDSDTKSHVKYVFSFMWSLVHLPNSMV